MRLLYLLVVSIALYCNLILGGLEEEWLAVQRWHYAALLAGVGSSTPGGITG
jgi:hypothetical protein